MIFEKGIRKRPFVPMKGVSNIELFYDLIFVYCISVVTSLCHNISGDFLDWNTWLIYTFSFIVILQVWFSSTFLLNRYGERSLPETAGLFINMFLMYFLANGVKANWHESSFVFNLSWAGILVNLALQWLIKLRTYTNLDDVDKRIMRWSAGCLLLQAGMAAVAVILPEQPSTLASWFALMFGLGVFARSRLYRKKPGRFSHLTERCALLTIIAFGEMVVGISTYMVNMSSMWYPVGVFALTVGLFLIYIFEHDHMLDHHAETDGMRYMIISLWLILIIGNLIVSVEYMPDERIAFLPKSIYVVVCLVLYLLTSFLLGMFNKPEYHYSKLYVGGRLAVCVIIVAVGLGASFDPAISLGCHVTTVWGAFLYEWILWRRRTRLVALGRSLGLTSEEMTEAGYDITTPEGQRNIERSAKQD